MGFRLYPERFSFGLTFFEYLEDMIDDSWILPCPKKWAAIVGVFLRMT